MYYIIICMDPKVPLCRVQVLHHDSISFDPAALLSEDIFPYTYNAIYRLQIPRPVSENSDRVGEVDPTQYGRRKSSHNVELKLQLR